MTHSSAIKIVRDKIAHVNLPYATRILVTPAGGLNQQKQFSYDRGLVQFDLCTSFFCVAQPRPLVYSSVKVPITKMVVLLMAEIGHQLIG